MLKEIAEKERVAYLDLYPALQKTGQPVTYWWVSPEDPHPNAACHKLIAEVLRAKISGMKGPTGR